MHVAGRGLSGQTVERETLRQLPPGLGLYKPFDSPCWKVRERRIRWGENSKRAGLFDRLDQTGCGNGGNKNFEAADRERCIDDVVSRMSRQFIP